ncbi:TPA: hypothetical protein ACH3X2_003918 [Trebouxia sp. C0005]
MPSQRGWTSTVKRRAERFLSLLEPNGLKLIVKEYAPSVPLNSSSDLAAAPRLILQALHEQYSPDELAGNFKLMQKKSMVMFFEESISPEFLSESLYDVDESELRKWMLEYWFKGPTSNIKAFSREFREYLDLEDKAMQSARDLRRTLEFSATSWQSVWSLLQAMDDEDTDALQKQLGMLHHSDHVPRALQGPGGPAKLLKACYADEVKSLLEYLDPKYEGHFPNRAECEDIILRIWASVSDASNMSVVCDCSAQCLLVHLVEWLTHMLPLHHTGYAAQSTSKEAALQGTKG